MLTYENFSKLREIVLIASEQKYNVLPDKLILNYHLLKSLMDYLYDEYLISFFWHGKHHYFDRKNKHRFLVKYWDYQLVFLEKMVFEFDTNNGHYPWLSAVLCYKLFDVEFDLARFIYLTEYYYVEEESEFAYAKKNLSDSIKQTRKALQIVKKLTAKQPKPYDVCLGYFHTKPQPKDTDVCLSPRHFKKPTI